MARARSESTVLRTLLASLALACAAALFLGEAVWADEVLLKSGARLEGQVQTEKCAACQVRTLACWSPSRLSKIRSFFWVPQASGDPARLGRIWLSADEVDKLRKTLR